MIVVGSFCLSNESYETCATIPSNILLIIFGVILMIPAPVTAVFTRRYYKANHPNEVWWKSC